MFYGTENRGPSIAQSLVEYCPGPGVSSKLALLRACLPKRLLTLLMLGLNSYEPGPG
jgi:hypothetical protein